MQGRGKSHVVQSVIAAVSLPRSRPVFADLPGHDPGLTRIGVGVEKLILWELAENSSRQDALQTIFSDGVDIFYHRI
jgi:hypothetical protein